MAKKQETFSFIDQPRWHKGSIHNEFVAGKKTDYALQLVPTDALTFAGEYFQSTDAIAIVHLPLGVIGAAPYRALERDKIEDTTNPVVGVELWTDGIRPGHFVVTADGQRFTRIKRRRSANLMIAVRKPILQEVSAFAGKRLETYAAGDLELQPGAVEVPTREGRTWLWSARWRELYADPRWKVRPLSLSEDGLVHYLDSSDISFLGVVSK